jgi:hypothetical protein
MQEKRTTRTAPPIIYKKTIYSNSCNYYTQTGEETQAAWNFHWSVHNKKKQDAHGK